jgi:ribonucleoside-triphosphate reductase
MYEDNFDFMPSLTVETIGDDLEILLMEEYPRIAKSYILYRQKRTEERERNNLITKEVIKATRAIDTKEANANMDEKSIGGRVGAASDIIQQRLALEYDMSPEVAQAHKDMIVYTHDLNYYSSGAHNCLTIDIGKLLTEGYWTRNGSIRPAGSFRTAAQLIPVIFQTQSLNQFGGVASMHIDYDLAPFVKKSFRKILQKHLNRQVGEDFKVRDDIGIDERYAPNREYKEKYPNAWDWALEDLKEEVQQGCESLFHNLNTLESRAGSQLPFSSINFGRDTSAEGRLVTKSILEASIKGVGKEHSTPIFPISIFCIKDGVNKKPGDPNYDLKLLALKSLSKRIFPNFANGNCILAKEDPNDIDTIFATMGKCKLAHVKSFEPRPRVSAA